MKKMTPEQLRKATPATEQWVQDALKMIGQPALNADNNTYAYMLRRYELAFPRLARMLIPLFAKTPKMPWHIVAMVHFR